MSLTAEERRLRSKVAGLTASLGEDDPRTVAARKELERGKREAEQWLRDQVEESRLHPLTETQLLQIATIIRVATKAVSP